MKDFNKRINRIVGQLRGIERMTKEERECVDILQQITAVKKAIDGLAKEIVISDICRLVPKEQKQTIDKMVQAIIKL